MAIIVHRQTPPGGGTPCHRKCGQPTVPPLLYRQGKREGDYLSSDFPFTYSRCPFPEITRELAYQKRAPPALPYPSSTEVSYNICTMLYNIKNTEYRNKVFYVSVFPRY
ncbi:hypothetical protein AVEN_75063-1 [Araneus ventricosus]|uniref:Uncharacterized protein n=1 Tax=Araneus ventricosus TaxID=182803 RepID=A0A4Y2T9P6_ARAVE|nr:hypothetical protein AVEN_248784-1 [Araneus ventricosus]GBN96680.1 hypothetical protein AVEN_75063-1 [Araneus ventricosus]